MLHKQEKTYFTYKVIVSVAAILLSSCQDQGSRTTNFSEIQESDLTLSQMINGDHKRDEDKKIAKGMEALLDRDFQLASRIFNVLLIDDPLNAQVHTLNALTYHLMAKNGQVTKMTLAKAGFEQALKIDPNNTLALLQLGRIAVDKKDYVKAQEFFSNVLLQDSGDIDAQFELATASYHLGDLKTAAMSISRVMEVQPDEARNIRAASLIYAAIGNNEQAQVYLSKYSTLNIQRRHKKHLEKRVRDWNDLHKSGRLMAQATDENSADILPPPEEPEVADILPPPPEPETAGALPPEEESKISTPPTVVNAPTITPTAAPPPVVAVEPIEQPKQEIYKDEKEDMVVIDAVIMRVSETGTTQKGNNIMENFTLSLAPWTYYRAENSSTPITTGAPIFPNTNKNSAVGVPAGLAGAGTMSAGATSKLITRGISLGTINYSLNIANSGDEYIEIIGRPSLTATLGSEAKFFSGRNKHISVAGQFGGNITNTPIGTTLNVTLKEYKDGFITLDVKLIGSSLVEDLSAIDLADNSNTRVFNVNKDEVTTTVKVKAGESIMLAGITQRELSTSKSGFPILQNIPLIQYFFSKERSHSERKSVMYILTPRSYKRTIKETKRFFSRGEEFGNRPLLKELEMRHKDWYDPSLNSTIILQHLGAVYGEFRTGDLHEIKWGHKDDMDKQLKSIANFLWY